MHWNEKFKRKFPNAIFSKDIYKSDVKNLNLRLNTEDTMKTDNFDNDSLNRFSSLNRTTGKSYKIKKGKK